MDQKVCGWWLVVGTLVILAGNTDGSSGHCRFDWPKRLANCSDAQLTSVPHLPYNITKLDLRNNNLTVLNSSSFCGLSNLTRLWLNNNPIKVIQQGTFQCISNLKFLNLSETKLTIKQLEKNVFLYIPSIKYLFLRNMYPSFQLKNETLQGLRNTSIEVLDLSWNPHACIMENDTFVGLYTLKTFYMQYSQCSSFNLFAFSNNTSLETLDLRYSRLSDFPVFTYSRRGGPIIPALRSLDLTGNKISVVSDWGLRGLNNLTVLNLKWNDIVHLKGFFVQKLHMLQELHLTGNRIKYIDQSAFASDSLQVIHLEQNFFTLDESHQYLFRYPKNIREIYLENTGFVDNSVLKTMFQNISTLKVLHLVSMSRIAKFPHHTLKGLTNLTTLHLSNNAILQIDRSMFSDLRSLKKLHLDGNLLSIINITSIPSFMWASLEELNLANNPFQCTCELFWFKDWMNSTRGKAILIMNDKKYQCATPIPTKHQDVSFVEMLNEHHCLTRPLGSEFLSIMLLSSFLVLLTSVLTTYYKYRWTIRLWHFRFDLWLNFNPKPPNRTHTMNCAYDLFVSYNSEDSPWVRHHLIPELEKKSNPAFRLCLSERDWLVGHDIVGCIEESLELSRCTLLVVTNAYARSQWCQLELTMAQHNLFDTDNDNVIMAVMEDIDPINMMPRLALEMKRKTYLQWTADEAGQILFWEKLKKTLRSPSNSVIQSLPPRQTLQQLISTE